MFVLVFFFFANSVAAVFAFNQSVDSFESYSQKNKGGVPAIRATEYKKIRGRKKSSRTRTSGAKVHKSNILIKGWHNKYEIFN